MYNVKIDVYPKWDKTHLYLSAEVYDRDWINNEDGANIWTGDCIQFALKTAKGKWQEYGIARTAKGPQIYRWIDNPGDRTGPVTGAKLEVIRQENRTIYQLALPWAEAGETNMQAGAEIGFSLAVWDRANERDMRCATWGGGITESKAPGLFYKLILADKVEP